jgi:opacity protein-like surface antigen
MGRSETTKGFQLLHTASCILPTDQEVYPFMKSLRILALVALTLALAPTLAGADFGVRAGRSNDTHENFVGIDMLFDLGAINVNPNLEYSLADNVTAGSANIDLTVDVVQIAALRPYVGAGVGLAYFDTDLGTSETNVVGNLVGGVAFELPTLKPYAQVKYSRRLENGSDDDVSFAVGLRF